MKPAFRADLHCHSTCSDGSLSPTQLVELAAEAGLTGLAITDHDNIDAFKKAEKIAGEKGIKLIPGVELSTSHKQESVHILGYAFNVDDPGLKAFCNQHQERRLQRVVKILALLKENGIHITDNDIKEAAGGEITSIARPHVAMAMVKKGYVKDLKEAFHRFLGDNKICFIPGGMPSSEESIAIIHRAGGFAVLAHPHLLAKQRTARHVAALGCDGIECFYAKMPRDSEQKWINLANEKNLMITGGSDFHGASKMSLSLGCSWTSEETFQILYQRYLDNNPSLSL